MKKIIFLFVITCLVFVIFWFTHDNQLYIVNIGDDISCNNRLYKDIKSKLGNNLEKYINKCQSDMDIDDLINMIDNNEVIKQDNKLYRINNVLIKADIIIISIGNNNLRYYNQLDCNMYAYIDQVLIDMDKLLSQIRYYSKEKIYLYNYYGLDSKYLKYINNRLEQIASDYDIDIINISSFNKIDKNLIGKKTLKTIDF